MSLYDDIDEILDEALGDELIDVKTSVSVTFRHGAADGTYSPTTGKTTINVTTQAAKTFLSFYTSHEIGKSGGAIVEGDTKLIVRLTDLDPQPEVGDEVDYGGQRYSIVNITPMVFDGIAYMATIQCRRGGEAV